MAMFEPGHLHIERHALTPNDVSYNIHLDYEVGKNPKGEKGIQFTMHGSIQDKDMKETFFLVKEETCNFARDVTRIAGKYGITPEKIVISSPHKLYDKMFKDIREKMDMKPGDTVDLKDFE